MHARLSWNFSVEQNKTLYLDQHLSTRVVDFKHFTVMSSCPTIGNKRDSIAFGLDLEDNGGQVNIYNWSGPPGLREEIEETRRAARGLIESTFRRTLSSSSTSSCTSTSKAKRKKTIDDNYSLSEKPDEHNEPTMPPTLVPVRSASVTNRSATLSEGNQRPSSINIGFDSPVREEAAPGPTQVDNITSLVEENKVLREKNLALQDELLYQRETSIRKYLDDHWIISI